MGVAAPQICWLNSFDRTCRRINSWASSLRHFELWRELSRSSHPLLSFSGLNSEYALEAQTILEPLAPIRILADQNGWALLLGVNHTTNTAIHFAEKLAGRKQFTRWALMPEGIVECPGYPGCSDGFQSILQRLEMTNRRVNIGKALVQAIPLKELFTAVSAFISEDPSALLCNRPDCERCNSVRHSHHLRTTNSA